MDIIIHNSLKRVHVNFNFVGMFGWIHLREDSRKKEKSTFSGFNFCISRNSLGF